MSLYAKLNPNDSLLDSDEVSRYCSPIQYDLGRDEPKVSAFQRKESERNPFRNPSINRLQYFQLADRDSAVECIRQDFISRSYTIKKDGRFVVFSVGKAIAAALSAGNNKIEFTYTPEPRNPSHSSIVNLPEDPGQELEVAVAIKRLITRLDIYNALP